MGRHIICPNCGAPNNADASECQFCGTSLMKNSKEDKPLMKNSKKEEPKERTTYQSGFTEYTIEDKLPIKLDERIFEASKDEFSTDFHISLSKDIGHFLDSISLTFFRVRFSSYCGSNGVKVWLKPGKIVAGGKLYVPYSGSDRDREGENIDTMRKYCELSDCKIEYIRRGKEFIFVLFCQVIYNTFFDNTKYTEAADKFYECYLQSDVYKEKVKEEERKKEEIRKEKRERNDRYTGICFFIGGGIYMLLAAFFPALLPDPLANEFWRLVYGFVGLGGLFMGLLALLLSKSSN